MSRRLAQLSAELSAARLESAPAAPDHPVDAAAGGEWWADHTRISQSRAPLSLVPDPGSVAGERGPLEGSALPLRGRHCAEPRRGWASALPETLQGRLGIGPAHLTSVAVFIAFAMALTSWWIVRGDAREVETEQVAAQPAEPLVEPLATGSSPVLPPEPGLPPGASGGTVTVDVAGKVRRPGIAVLDAGSRVVDAVEAAGGAKPGVNLTSINLARVLVDGEQIVVGARLAVTPAAPGAPGSGGPDAGPLVNLNLASQSELETLPQVGPVTATSIIAWRGQNGGFTSVEELLEVDGIGPATLAQITPFATV